jgi:hypothetical protein
MRVVTDAKANTWICLELPSRGREAEPTVEVECNSGAERVSVTVPRDWESMTDAEFVQRILGALGR